MTENKYNAEVTSEEDINIMVISHDGKVLEVYADGGEPEDNLFTRRWSWVAYELRRAYELGMKDGREIANVKQ